MKAFMSTSLTEVVLVIGLTAIIGYFIGFPAMLVHSLMEIFCYAGLFVSSLVVYKLIRKLLDSIFIKSKDTK